MKKIIRTLISTMMACVSFSSFAHGPYKQTLLVMDMSNALHLPGNFRSTADSLPGSVNTAGLAELHIAGSGQFSKMGFQKILYRLHLKQLTIIDLRQEAHGFMNGNAISWYAPKNAANAGKTPEQIDADQAQLLDELAKTDVEDVYTILKKSKGYITKIRAKQYAVHQVMNEAQFAKELDQHYYRLYVQDHTGPDKEQVDRFIEIVRNFPKDEWIYFHCRGGVGRTTTFMTMYDMMRNARTVSFDDILERQFKLGGKDLTKPGVAQYKKAWAKTRLEFLKKFYEYAKSNEDNFATNYSGWLKA